MSTFKGVVAEFPDIRIDYFRKSNDPAAKPPLACFLSHVHSDHIQGLEGAFFGSFIYCSAATKELLIRLERRVHRLNSQKGLIETHDWRYKEKKNLLRTIPLDTPTWVEVGHRKLRVTLFDANHCVGAVMFLIEGGGKAVLYTGDIRAEDWWVDWLKRHPVMIPYTSGIKKLDKIYLDTSFGWRYYDRFTPKSEGIRQLLAKMQKYPEDTVFHLNTWTFGYEDVWVALAAAFQEKIHLSRYHYELFMSLKQIGHWTNGPYLGGFKLGNTTQEAIITTNPEVRIHSCERDLGCPGLNKKNVVYITPIIAHIDDKEVTEAGLDFGDLASNEDFSLYGQIQVLLDYLGPTIPASVKKMVIEASRSRKQTIPLRVSEEDSLRVLSVEDVLQLLADAANKQTKQHATTGGDQNWPGTESIQGINGELLTTWIKFTYSRHSSLGELRNLVGAFRPKDIYPCVTDEVAWTEDNSMETLFGNLCSDRIFAHDAEMRAFYDIRLDEEFAQDAKRLAQEEESQFRPDGHAERTSSPAPFTGHRPTDPVSLTASSPTPRPSPTTIRQQTSLSSALTALPLTETQQLEQLEAQVRQQAGMEVEAHTLQPHRKPPQRHPPLFSSQSSEASHPPASANTGSHISVSTGAHHSTEKDTASGTDPDLPATPAHHTTAFSISGTSYPPQSLSQIIDSSTASESELDLGRDAGHVIPSSPPEIRRSSVSQQIHREEKPSPSLLKRRKTDHESPIGIIEEARRNKSGQRAAPLADTIAELVEAQDMEREEVELAAAAALRKGGRSWWDIRLETVEKKWRYEPEEEL